MCLKELERLNKEIETVRHEVEQEKRRLSYYRIRQTGRKGSKNISTSNSERENKNLENKSYGTPISTGTSNMYFQAEKYVVDNSKPRTDLEYDPLSNFSAGLHPGAQPKLKNGIKKPRYSEPDCTKLIECEAPRPPTSPSPEPQDDLIEDGVLIIDIPSSPDATEGTDQKPLYSSASKSPKDQDLSEFQAVACSSPRHARPIAPKDSRLSTIEYVEQKMGQTRCFQNQKIDKIVYQSAEMEAKKIAESASITLLPEPLMKRHDSSPQVASQYDMSKVLQPSYSSSNNSLFYEASVGHSDPQCRQKRETPSAGGPGQGVAADDKAPPPSCLDKTEPGLSCQTLAAEKQSDSRSVEMIIKSSSDEDDEDQELNYSDLDLSESDPMEECFRIFMEDNKKEHESELPQTPVSMWLTVMG